MKPLPFINKYYLDLVDEMQVSIDNSDNGKRVLNFCNITGEVDATCSTSSTFPEWVKFFYNHTPKRKRLDYLEEGKEAYVDGYFNGNTREVNRILKRLRKGYLPKSKRLYVACEIMLEGFLSQDNQTVDYDLWEYI